MDKKDLPKLDTWYEVICGKSHVHVQYIRFWKHISVYLRVNNQNIAYFLCLMLPNAIIFSTQVTLTSITGLNYIATDLWLLNVFASNFPLVIVSGSRCFSTLGTGIISIFRKDSKKFHRMAARYGQSVRVSNQSFLSPAQKNSSSRYRSTGWSSRVFSSYQNVAPDFFHPEKSQFIPLPAWRSTVTLDQNLSRPHEDYDTLSAYRVTLYLLFVARDW